MSKHDVERANARRAVEVSTKRMRKAASIKRGMTMAVKATATSAAIAGGVYAVNKYLTNHNVTLNGKSVRFSSQTVSSITKLANGVKDALGYFY